MELHKLQKAMHERGLDAVVAASPENVLYSTGAYIMTQKALRDRLAYAVFPQEGEPTFIVCGIELSLAQEETWISDLRAYVEFQQSPTSMLIDVLREKDLASAKVGFESRFLPYKYMDELRLELPKMQMDECGTLFTNLRMYKSPKEIEALRWGAKATCDAVMNTFRAAKVGDTEKDLANSILKALLDAGAQDLEFVILGVGERSLITHPTPGATAVEPGKVVRVDVGGLFDGYVSDLARTVLGPKPTRRQVYVLRTLGEIHKEIISRATVGTKFSDLYNHCQAMFEKAGLPFRMPHIGHGMGVELHEDPMINPLNHNVLEENMILNIEPLCVDDESESGYHVEDLVLVTKDGPEILTGSDLDPEPVVIGG